MEGFKPVKGYENLYEISSNGEIYSLTKRVILRSHIGRSGYAEVRMKKNGKVKHENIHRLLALNFIPNPLNKPCVDHIDGNKLNNSLDNLRWCSHKENSNNPNAIRKFSESAKRAWKNGRIMSNDAIKKRNESHYKAIIQYTLEWQYIQTWKSIKDASKFLGICHSQICEACVGKRVKTAKGFIFKFADRQEDQKSRFTVDSDEAMQYGSEPLAKIKKIK